MPVGEGAQPGSGDEGVEVVQERSSVVVAQLVEGGEVVSERVLRCVEGPAGSGLDEQVIAGDVEGLGELHHDVG